MREAKPVKHGKQDIVLSRIGTTAAKSFHYEFRFLLRSALDWLSKLAGGWRSIRKTILDKFHFERAPK